MAGTTKTTRIATLEDVTRYCGIGIAARATLLEEGITLARQTRVQLAEVEQHFGAALNALTAVKPAFAGTSEYMLTCSRLLAELIGGLESELLDLREIQVVVTGLEEPTAEIFQQILTYSVDAIQARIRGRMNKLGGDFSMALPQRPNISLAHSMAPSRRRSELPLREFVMVDIEDGLAMDGIVRAGLDNFERSGAMLEGCYDSLVVAQGVIANASRGIEAVSSKFRALEEMESSANSSEITGAVAQLRRLIEELATQVSRLERLGGAPERVRAPLLAVLENMGRLLVTGLVSDANPVESRETSANEILQRALKGDVSAVAEFCANADAARNQAMSDALYHAARTQELESALCAVEALRTLARTPSGSQTDAGDNLLSLSNNLSVSEAVRSAATAALLELTEGSDQSP